MRWLPHTPAVVRSLGSESRAVDRPARRLVLGLGNVGAKYCATRHNLGFMVLDQWAQRLALPAWEEAYPYTR